MSIHNAFVFDFLKKWDENVYIKFTQLFPDQASDELRTAVFDTLQHLFVFIANVHGVSSVSAEATVGGKDYKVRLATTNAAYARSIYTP